MAQLGHQLLCLVLSPPSVFGTANPSSSGPPGRPLGTHPSPMWWWPDPRMEAQAQDSCFS